MFKVTVSKKNPDHSSYNQGAQLAYVINGNEDYTLRLKKGKTYTFDVDAVGHPFFMTTDPVGSSKKGSLMGPGEKATDKGTVTFKVRENLPDNFYYQCQRHPKMGGKVIIVSEEKTGHDKYKKYMIHLFI